MLGNSLQMQLNARGLELCLQVTSIIAARVIPFFSSLCLQVKTKHKQSTDFSVLKTFLCQKSLLATLTCTKYPRFRPYSENVSIPTKLFALQLKTSISVIFPFTCSRAQRERRRVVARRKNMTSKPQLTRTFRGSKECS